MSRIPRKYSIRVLIASATWAGAIALAPFPGQLASRMFSLTLGAAITVSIAAAAARNRHEMRRVRAGQSQADALHEGLMRAFGAAHVDPGVAMRAEAPTGPIMRVVKGSRGA